MTDDPIARLAQINKKLASVRTISSYKELISFLDNDVKWLMEEVARLHTLTYLQAEEAKVLIESIDDSLKRIQSGLFAEAERDVLRDEVERLTIENERLQGLLSKPSKG